ncbi:MAG: hypothetical protein HZB16_08510 [Armatimonadetes bacterium]|nr:hypothetical protein [Armatimonadota bacterium]
MKRVRSLCWVAVLALVCGSAAQAVPSKYVKEQAVKAVAKVLAGGADAMERYGQLKADGKLDELKDGEPRSLALARRLRNTWDDGFDAYCEALAEGWTADDADMTKMREALDSAREKFEACGMWVAVRLGEPIIPGNYRNRLEVIRDLVAGAAAKLQAKMVDEATEDFDSADKRMKGIATEAENAADNGDKTVISPKHPAIKRTLDEIARLKGTGAGVLADTAKLREAVDADIKALLATYAKMDEVFRTAEGATSISGNYEDRKADYDKALAVFKTWFAEQRPALAKQLKEFTDKYGATEQAVETKLAELMGHRIDTTPSPGYAFARLTEGLAKTSENAKEVAAKLYQDATGTLDGIDKYSEDIRLSVFDREKAKIEAALTFDPDNADIKARLDKAVADRAACAAKIEAAIDARTWPGNTKNFAGPGTVEALAASCLAYLRGEAKEGDEVLSVRVTGNWEGGEKDALGRLINYQLPILVAYRLKVDKDAGKDLAKVFELSMITLDLKKAPPWKYSATLGNWRMRYSKMPK